MKLEIQSVKLILSLIDEETGEIITREATLGDFNDSIKPKRKTSTKSKKNLDTDPIAKITLLDNKIQFNAAAVEMTGFEPEQKLEIKFEKKGRKTTPVLCEDEKSGNRLTKTYTVSCRGSRHDNLAEFGTVFEVVPYEGKDGYYKLIGDASEKEDDIIDVPEEIADPDSNVEINDESGVDIDDFELEF